MYYMLNLVFNFNDSSAGYGRFVDYSSTQTNVLSTSKAWLQPAPTAPTPPDPNNSAHWIFFERDKQHLDFPLTEQPNLWVRVMDTNQSTDNFTTRITILMARNDQGSAQQAIASPIVNPNLAAGPLTIWDTAYVPANNGSWVMELGQATQSNPTASNLNKYIFIVAATVESAPTRTFTHDPDMNIDC